MARAIVVFVANFKRNYFFFFTVGLGVGVGTTDGSSVGTALTIFTASVPPIFEGALKP